jgi:DNA-binding HxlR family transcriptional regulator
VDGYGQYCPIALGAEVFAERWTPIILRNLMVGCCRFGEVLEGAPGLSRSVLAQRLRSLERAGVLVLSQDGGRTRYGLTRSGVELCEVVLALGVWGARWRQVAPEQLDPYLMLWALSRLIDPASVGGRRVVVRFDLDDGSKPDRYWLVVSPLGNELCVTPPGDAEDAVVRTDCAWLHRWHSGLVGLGQAQRAGGMDVTGPPWACRALNRWGRLSPFSGVPRAATGR